MCGTAKTALHAFEPTWLRGTVARLVATGTALRLDRHLWHPGSFEPGCVGVHCQLARLQASNVIDLLRPTELALNQAIDEQALRMIGPYWSAPSNRLVARYLAPSTRAWVFVVLLNVG